MKFTMSNLVLIIAFIFVMPFHSKAFTNSASNNEVKDEHIWLSSHSEPEPAYLPSDPGIPEAPLDNNMYFLIAASLVYGFVLFRKEKRLKL